MLCFIGIFILLFANIEQGFASPVCGQGLFEPPSSTLNSGVDDILTALTPTEKEAAQSGTALYIFVSLSMSKPALIALNQEAARFGSLLVLRGLKDNQYKKTAEYLKPIIDKSGQGFLINPQWFTQYQIDKVPTFVFSKTDAAGNVRFDKVSGHISVTAALEQIEKSGELSPEAKEWRRRVGP